MTESPPPAVDQTSEVEPTRKGPPVGTAADDGPQGNELAGVELAGVGFDYGAGPVLQGLDLRVPAGALLAVTGESGSGKTTMLRLVAGFERPGTGSVSVAGTVVAGPGRWLPTHRRRVGVVPQEGALFPHLDVAANIGYGLGRRLPGREARVAELAELVGLAHLLTRYPRELSGGQQQRVALARALAPRPDVVLLDEPFAALDRSTRLGLRRRVREILRAEGVTGVLVTHDREEALSVADLVTVLARGRVVQTGTPTEVYDRPVDPLAATLLGEAMLLPVIRRDGSRVETVLGAVDVHPEIAPADRPAGVTQQCRPPTARQHVGSDGGTPVTPAGRTQLAAADGETAEPTGGSTTEPTGGSTTEPTGGVGRSVAVVRPEQVVLTESGAEAAVELVEFLGPTTRLEARLADGTLVGVSGAGLRVELGHTVRLGLRGPVAVVPAPTDLPSAVDPA